MVADRIWGQTWFRNRWKDKDDIVISALPQGHGGYHKVPGGNAFIWGFGERAELGFGGGKPTGWRAAARGGTVTTAAASFGVDFSGAAGVDGLVVLAWDKAPELKNAKGRIKGSSVTAGGRTFTVVTISGSGTHPAAEADGDGVRIGGQRASVVEGHLTFAK